MLLLGGKHFEIERWRQSSHFLKVLIEGGFGIKTGTIGYRKHIDIQFICAYRSILSRTIILRVGVLIHYLANSANARSKLAPRIPCLMMMPFASTSSAYGIPCMS